MSKESQDLRLVNMDGSPALASGTDGSKPMSNTPDPQHTSGCMEQYARKCFGVCRYNNEPPKDQFPDPDTIKAADDWLQPKSNHFLELPEPEHVKLVNGALKVPRKDQPSLRAQIASVLDNTILDWNKPSQLETLDAHKIYIRLVPALEQFFNQALAEAKAQEAEWALNRLIDITNGFKTSAEIKQELLDRIATLKEDI